MVLSSQKPRPVFIDYAVFRNNMTDEQRCIIFLKSSLGLPSLRGHHQWNDGAGIILLSQMIGRVNATRVTQWANDRGLIYVYIGPQALFMAQIHYAIKCEER